MMHEVLQVISPGLGTTVQDLGRPGWKRYGVPPSGAMDRHAACWANRLVQNPPAFPVLEMLLHGARFRALHECWIAVTGAEIEATVPTWRVVPLQAGQEIHFVNVRSGVWSYLAVAGKLAAKRFFRSASVYARGQLGAPLQKHDAISLETGANFSLPIGVAGQFAPWSERRAYSRPPALRVWPGPQCDRFTPSARTSFFSQEWTVSPQSDRVGYRLAGTPLEAPAGQLISEPVRVGTIQIPEGGQPIVTMPDGPTVGGYPKLGMVDPDDLPWLAQSLPGRTIRFQLFHEEDLTTEPITAPAA